MKNIVAIIGSASSDSSNLKLVQYLQIQSKHFFHITIYDQLKELPHFSPELSIENTPPAIIAFRQLIENADGVLISTPEYIFSIPSGLKNILEWSVSTTIFSKKPLAVLTASASGEKGHEELILIMQTLMANCTSNTTLLIKGIKGKMNDKGMVEDEETRKQLSHFLTSFRDLVS